ncbi:MAG TPA: hypothetical protein DCL38_03345, partial [Lachnospiraceae bacterium]|nr:hypothetical protein [Lachnospiraceae bacterium]
MAGNSDYGGGTSGGSHGGGGFISDLETEALSWVIAIALVIIMIIYYALIKPIIDKIRGKKPEDEDEETDEVLRMRELRGGSPDGQKLRPIKEYGELDPGFQESALCERLSNLYVQLQTNNLKHIRRRLPMRYYITILVLSLGFLLSGYKQVSDSSAYKTSTQANRSANSDNVHDDGKLTERECRIISRDLNSMEYYGFLLSEYDSPQYIDWHEVFYNGAGLEEVKWTTAVEKAYLEKTGNREVIADLTILDAEDVKDYVKRTTGLPYAKMRNPLDWVYIKKMNIYVFEHGDTNWIECTVLSGYVEDGVYTVRYLHDNWWGDNADCEFEVCFTKNDNDYCFISNTPDLNTKGAGDYIFPDSASRNLKEADLAGLDKETLRIGRNEIYARHGRKFKDSALQSYFNSKSWYYPTDVSDSAIEKSLNQYEKNNIKFIQSYENKAPVSSATGSQSSKSSGSGSQKSASGYTNVELCKMAQDYY